MRGGAGWGAGGNLALEVLAVKRCPGLLFHQWKTIIIIGHAPAMTVHQTFTVTLALTHQCVLCRDEAALHASWLVCMQGIKAAHWRSPDSRYQETCLSVPQGAMIHIKSVVPGGL